MRYGAGGPGQLCRVVVRAPRGARRCVTAYGRSPRINAGPLLRATALALLCQPCQAQDLGGGGNDSTAAVVGKWLAVVALVAVSGLFCGLTLGYLSLDIVGLEIVLHGGNPVEAAAAKKIIPVRKDGNLVLCTLVVGNVAANSLLAILLAGITTPLVGFLLATFVITIFGEILPQAICSRHALRIGASVIPLMHFILFLFWPVCKPMAIVLDKTLGVEASAIHTRSELRELLALHVRHGALDAETGKAMEGALRYKRTEVRSAMTVAERVYMLSADTSLTSSTMQDIVQHGRSRIPVYGDSRNDIMGVLHSKDLIFVDPEDAVPVRHFMQLFGRSTQMVWPDQSLTDVIQLLKQACSYMATVFDVNNTGEGDPFYEFVGIITLEDIIEELLGDEIYDETDNQDGHGDAEADQQYNRASCVPGMGAAHLRLLNASSATSKQLTDQEALSIAQHLCAHTVPFQALPIGQVTTLLRTSPVLQLSAVGGLPPALDEYLYRRGHVSSICTVVISGRLRIVAGRDEVASELGKWTVLAADALRTAGEEYYPDFSAFAANESDSVRVVCISAAAFKASVVRHDEPAPSTLAHCD